MNSTRLVLLVFATILCFATCADTQDEQKPMILSPNDDYNEIVIDRLQHRGEGKFEANAEKESVHHQQYHVISFEASGMPVTHAQVEGGLCKGWWQKDGYNLTDKDSESTQWFLNHCYIIDEQNPQKIYPIEKINFGTPHGKRMLVSDWLCRANNSGWEFKFTKCEWTKEDNLPKTVANLRKTHFRHAKLQS